MTTQMTIFCPHLQMDIKCMPVLQPSSNHYAKFTPTRQAKFPTPSSTGNNYIMVLYKHDSNAILNEPFKDCSIDSILNTFKSLHACLCHTRLWPCLQCLDKQSIDCSQNFPHWWKYQLPISTAVCPSMQCSQTCNLRIQKSLHCWALQHQCQFSLALMGLIVTTSRTNPQSASWMPLQPQGIHPQTIWL